MSRLLKHNVAKKTLIQIDQGRVLCAKENTATGQFELSQILYSRGNEKVELFGIRLAFDENILAITAKNVQSQMQKLHLILTEGLSFQTTWDNNFTTFAKKFVDTGVVYPYENISGNLVYGLKLAYNELQDPNTSSCKPYLQ